MALYFYHAFTKDGKKTTGFIDAPSVTAAREQLSRTGLFPTKVDISTEESKQPWWRRIFTRSISTKDKILFTKQLAILLRSGVQLLPALELLIEQFSGNLRTILITVKDEVKEGSSLADALKKYPKVFDNIYVQLVRAGEASGKLETILERLIQYMERNEALKKRVSDALRYPMIQLIISALVVAVLMIKVVPTLAENFAGMGKELPLPTKIMMNVSEFFQSYWIIFLIFFILVYLAYRYWKSTPSGARKIDQIKLKVPIVKFFARTGAVVQFSQTLGMLLEGGVNLPEALDIVCNVVDNRILADTLREAREKIIKQGNISQYLKQTDIFPPTAIYLISTGEQSGQLDKMLLTVAHNYESELNDLADNLSALISPIMLIVMAFIVGFIVLSIALPMFSVGEAAGI